MRKDERSLEEEICHDTCFMNCMQGSYSDEESNSIYNDDANSDGLNINNSSFFSSDNSEGTAEPFEQSNEREESLTIVSHPLEDDSTQKGSIKKSRKVLMKSIRAVSGRSINATKKITKIIGSQVRQKTDAMKNRISKNGVRNEYEGGIGKNPEDQFMVISHPLQGSKARKKTRQIITNPELKAQEESSKKSNHKGSIVGVIGQLTTRNTTRKEQRGILNEEKRQDLSTKQETALENAQKKDMIDMSVENTSLKVAELVSESPVEYDTERESTSEGESDEASDEISNVDSIFQDLSYDSSSVYDNESVISSMSMKSSFSLTFSRTFSRLKSSTNKSSGIHKNLSRLSEVSEGTNSSFDSQLPEYHAVDKYDTVISQDGHLIELED